MSCEHCATGQWPVDGLGARSAEQGAIAECVRARTVSGRANGVGVGANGNRAGAFDAGARNFDTGAWILNAGGRTLGVGARKLDVGAGTAGSREPSIAKSKERGAGSGERKSKAKGGAASGRGSEQGARSGWTCSVIHNREERIEIGLIGTARSCSTCTYPLLISFHLPKEHNTGAASCCG